MKIREVIAVPVRVPRTKPMLSAGTDAPLRASDFGIVRLRDADGIEGIGEISMNGEPSGATQCRQVTEVLGPILIGREAADIRGAIVAMNEALDGHLPAKAAIEMALFDLLGKRRGMPVYELLGGRVRERVPLRWSMGYGSPQAAVEEFALRLEQGMRVAKLKIGRAGTGEDEAIVRAFREHFGDSIEIMVDANAGYASADEAVAELQPLERYGLQLIEQPVPRAPLEPLAEVRRRLSTPILADESMRHFSDAFALAQAVAADVLSVYVCESGGLLAASKAFAVAEAAGLPCTIGGQCELGIGTVAMAHLGVTMPNLAYESDITGHLRYPVDVIAERLTYTNGAVSPPALPGLGVTLAEDAVESFRLDV